MTIISRSSAVAYIMTRHLYLLNASDSLLKAKRMFKEHSIRHLPVIADRQVVGILSHVDLIRLNFDGDVPTNPPGENQMFLATLKVEDIMQKNPDVVSENESIEAVAIKLNNEKFHALPVINEQGISGIVTTTDLINFFLSEKDVKFSEGKMP